MFQVNRVSIFIDAFKYPFDVVLVVLMALQGVSSSPGASLLPDLESVKYPRFLGCFRWNVEKILCNSCTYNSWTGHCSRPFAADYGCNNPSQVLLLMTDLNPFSLLGIGSLFPHPYSLEEDALPL